MSYMSLATGNTYYSFLCTQYKLFYGLVCCSPWDHEQSYVTDLVTEQQQRSLGTSCILHFFFFLLELFSFHCGSSTVVQEPIRVPDILLGTYESSTIFIRRLNHGLPFSLSFLRTVHFPETTGCGMTSPL